MRVFHAQLYISKLLIDPSDGLPMGIAVLIRCATAQPVFSALQTECQAGATQQQEISSVFGISQFGHSRIFWSQTQSLAILQSACASTAPITERHV